MRPGDRTPEANERHLAELVNRTAPLGFHWLNVRIDLLRGNGQELHRPPGRIILVGPDHTFRDLQRSIEACFGRWDLMHLHSFEFESGLCLGPAEVPADDNGFYDDQLVRVTEALRPGSELTYIFDLGDDWTHTIKAEEPDHDQLNGWLESTGNLPKDPVVLMGWGELPDQYGRLTEHTVEPPPPTPLS